MNRLLRLTALFAAMSASAAFVLVPRFAGAGAEDAAGAEVVTLAPVPLSPHQGGHLTTGDPPSQVIYPKQRIDITFHHRAHVLGVGESCHPGALKSSSTKDFLIPPKGKCLECHEDDLITWDCGKDVKDSALVMPAAHLRFSHQEHMKQDGIKCMSCHQGVDEAEHATVDHLPKMEACIACHEEKGAPADCRTCHVGGRSATIRTAYATGKLVPDDHGVLYLEQHGQQAQRDLGYCASCHAQEDCLSCHDGAVPPSFHASNYLQLHPQCAMANNPQCASCHRLERFCRDCHFKAEVTLGNPLAYGNGMFHGADWMVADTPDFHGNIGRKNLASCAGCHVKNDCTVCHAFYQGAPQTHPPGWANSRRMRNLVDANVSMCMEWHGQGETGDPFPGP